MFIVLLALLIAWGVDRLAMIRVEDRAATPTRATPSSSRLEMALLPAYLPCQPAMRVSGISATSVHPGDTFEMYGRWGEPARNKVPVINRGSRNDLEVVTWTPSILTLRVPEGLPAGRYKTGVYCFPEPNAGDGDKTWYSSGFKEIRVLDAFAIP